MSDLKQRVAIVGGGISGLAAAFYLQATANEIHLFESNEQLGGVLQTEEADGFRMESGPDSILSRQAWGVELCKELGIADDLIGTNPSQRGVFVVRRGRLQRVPDGLALMAPQRIWPFVTTPILSWAGKMRLAAEPFIARRTDPSDESLADFARRRLGREAFERLVQPMAGGIYMGDPEQLSVQATFPQFVAMESKYGSLIRAARAGAKTQGAQTKSNGPQYSMFVTPRLGLGQLVDALVKRLDPCKVKIHCQSQVERLRPGPDHHWEANVSDLRTGAQRRETFAGAIIAAPAFATAEMLADTDARLSGLLTDIPYAGCVVVNMAFERNAISHDLDSFGFVAPHIENRAVLACTFSSVKYADRAPAGKVLLRLFLGGGCYPEVLDWTDERVLIEVRRELNELLGVTAPPLFSRIKRWRRALPQYGIGHLARTEKIDERLQALVGLELAGNAYGGVGVPHCIRSGQQASERLSETLLQTRAPEYSGNSKR